MNQNAVNNCSIEYLRDHPDYYFDLAVFDPPQGDGTATAIASKSGTEASIGYPIERGQYPESKWDKQRASLDFFNQVFRVSKNQIVWCATHYLDYPHISPAKSWLIWNKLTTGNYGDAELAWTSFKGSNRMITYLWNGSQQGKSLKNGHVQQGDKSKNEPRIHPTHKPSKLYEWIYSKYLDKSAKILDPTMGSGSSRIAAARMDIEYLGIEKDTQHFRDHLAWWHEYISSPELF